MSGAISDQSVQSVGNLLIEETWGVWDVTHPTDTYCVEDGLTKEEAIQRAKMYTADSSITSIDPETGTETDAQFEAKETTIQGPSARPQTPKIPNETQSNYQITENLE